MSPYFSIALQPEIRNAPEQIESSQLKTEIEVKNLTIAFNSRRQSMVAVEGLSFEARSGEFIAVLGPSGCGKSSLLNAIAGFEQPTDGSICVSGTPVTKPGPERGVVFQQPHLFPWKTVRDNVAYGPRMSGKSRPEARAIADEFIAMVGLSRFAKAYPHTLSGGMQQRVAIARALAIEPTVLLMDEPFGALDAQTRSVMQANLLQLWSKISATIVFVTHDIDEAILLADRVLIMSAAPGRIIEDVTIDLPRPRHLELLLDSRFMAFKRDCFALIQQQGEQAFDQRLRPR